MEKTPNSETKIRAATRDDRFRVWEDLLLPIFARPKTLFMLAAGLSFLMSVFLFFNGDRDRGIFVGIWVPSILSAGNLLLTKDDHYD